MIEALHLQELLHNLTQALLYPTMAVLLLLIVYAVWCIGSVAVEAVVERRHFKVTLPELLASVEGSAYSGLFDVIEGSGLLGFQKRDVQTLIAYGYLPEESRVALAKRLLTTQEGAYAKVVSRTDTAAKVSPMVGLMGTLIPLGPGVVALGQAQTELLSSSIMIAFDTTIAGLVVAIVALLVSRWRRRWYEDYMSVMEALMAATLEKAHLCAQAGDDLGDAQRAREMVERSERLHPRKRAGKSATPQPQPAPTADAGPQPVEGGE